VFLYATIIILVDISLIGWVHFVFHSLRPYFQSEITKLGCLQTRAYSKRGVQPKCGVQEGNCALWSPKSENVDATFLCLMFIYQPYLLENVSNYL
jgi:hypothetical protein